MEKKLANTSKGIIEYTLKGNGPVILNLHGGHSNCEEKLGYKPLIEAGYSILTPSRPGYGRTPSSTGSTPEEASDAMIALLDYLNIEKVFVIGVSAGGPTSIYLTSKYSNRIKKLVLESAVTKEWLTKDDMLYKIGKIIFNPKIQKITWFMIRSFNNLFPHFFAKMYLPQFSTLSNKKIINRMTEKDLEEIKRMNNRYSSGKGFINDVEHRIKKETLKKVKVPTLIIHSKYDKSVSYEHAKYAKRNIYNSQLFTADFWGHLIYLGKEKEKRNEKLIDFLNEGLK